MTPIETAIPGVLLLEPRVFADERGFFLESWNAATFRQIGLDLAFVQDNHSHSARGVLRGMHLQRRNPQGKLVRAVSGRIWDVAVDLRRSSATFGQSVGAELSAANRRLFWIPPGFAHGFLSLEDGTDVLYKCTTPYDPADEQVLAWDDAEVAIDWPLAGIAPLLSPRDRAGLPLAQIETFA